MTPNSRYATRMAELPLYMPEEIIGSRDVLVIAPHPDDESLGCGGLLAWAAATQRHPRVLFMTDGERSHPGSALFPPHRLARRRREEALDACAALGIDAADITFLGLPDSGIAELSESKRRDTADTLANWAAMSSASVVLVTAPTDGHSDHIATHAIASAAAKRCPAVQLFSYPVWTWIRQYSTVSQAPVGRRIDISEFKAAKCAAIASHRSQHGAVVPDAPNAFVLPPELLARANQDFEVLLDAAL